jgi:hypothetical protein
MLPYRVKDIDRKIEMFDGRPDRDDVIDKNDIINLKIAMNRKVSKKYDAFYYFLMEV